MKPTLIILVSSVGSAKKISSIIAGEMGSELWRLVFVNAGVKLTIKDSETLESLQELERSGVHILVCGTCLNHFHLLEKKRPGKQPICWTLLWQCNSLTR